MKASSTLSDVKILTLVSLLFILPLFAVSQQVSNAQQKQVAKQWLINHNLTEHIISGETEIDNGKNTIATAFNLLPEGFVVITADKSLRPVISYSLMGYYEDGNHPLSQLIIKDISNRLQDYNETHKAKNIAEWDAFLSGEKQTKTVQYWPEAGSTTTGGWVEEQWSQGSPYNTFCPLDLANGGRSIAGCPSIALGMIIDFTKTIHNTQFNDADDYHHNYGGNNYYIDNDYVTYDFPDFPALNVMLEGISLKYANGESLNMDDKAALIFACGVAARQVYGSGGSGTFGVDQAWDAYQRFGFEDSKLIYETDTSFFTQMKENIMAAMPVHLAVLVENGPGGHNVVADGYCTDDYYHINFGWGGMYNSWYDVPEELPYNLTVIEGAVVDIGTVTVGNPVRIFEEENIKIYPNPFEESAVLSIPVKEKGDIEVVIHDMTGQTRYMYSSQVENPGTYELNIGSLLDNGIYLVRICMNNQVVTKKLIREYR